MRRTIAAVLLLAFVLAGCTHVPVTLLDNETVHVSRSGREIRVSDVESGEECIYTIVRVKRNTGALSQESHVGNLTVLSGDGIMVVIGNGQSWIIRFAR